MPPTRALVNKDPASTSGVPLAPMATVGPITIPHMNPTIEAKTTNPTLGRR